MLNLKNAAVFRFLVDCDYLSDIEMIEDALVREKFKPCSLQQEFSDGFSPIGSLTYDDGVPIYLLTINDRWHLFCYTQEVKAIPADFFKSQLRQAVERYKERHGRDPNKAEREGLIIELKAELLPRAFPRSTDVYGYFDTQKKWLVLCTTSASSVEAIGTILRKTLGTLPVAPFYYEGDPSVAFTDWATTGKGISKSKSLRVLHDFEMRQKLDDVTSIVSCKQVQAGTEEITCHTESGKLVSKIALAFDDCTQFVLDDDVTLRSIKIDVDAEEAPEDAESLILSDTFLFCRTVDGIMEELHRLLPVKKEDQDAEAA